MPRWRLAAYGFALCVALALGHFIFRMPLQVSDNVAHIMRAQHLSSGEIIASEFSRGGVYMRPMMMIMINALFELAHGHYFVVFKAFHVLQLTAVLLMLVRPLQVRTAWDAAVSTLAVLAAVGMHTFFGTVYEGYPINTYMSILVSCMLAVNLAFGKPALWRDALGIALFAIALFTVETGVLVLVCLVVGYAVGFRGVSSRGLAGCAAVLVAYLLLRFVAFPGELPSLSERSSGLGFKTYGPDELNRMFGQGRLLFSIYNVACSVLTIFFAEPRAGVWRFFRDFQAMVELGEPIPPALLLYVLTSSVSSMLILSFAFRRRREWLQFRFDHHDRLVLVFLALALGNAGMSFSYTKDVIVSPAGLFYPLALFVAVRDLPFRGSAERRRHPLRALAPWVLALLSLGWTLRAAGVPFGLWHTAFKYQRQWVHIDEWLVAQKLEYDATQLQLLGRLRAEALRMPVPSPYELGRWGRWGPWIFDQP